jgi:hypothetical protein
MVYGGRKKGPLMTGLMLFTWFHTALSLIALVAGVVVMLELLKSSTANGWTTTLLVTMIVTDVTGFMFPFNGFLPSHAVGLISLAIIAVVIVARYVMHFSGAMRWIYASGIVIVVYLDAFVTVVQAFLKIPALNALAPTQGEPPFAIAQGIVLLIFVVFGIVAARKFHPAQG